ncbi:MAG TPA: hypothetical protein VFO58_18320 [Vicinamibacterales bacterium]|nr:hypothetical protein [Vicinamibacterales bacterium]
MRHTLVLLAAVSLLTASGDRIAARQARPASTTTTMDEVLAAMDDQHKGIQRYIETFDTTDDAGALALIQAHFDRDAKMVALRQRWLGDFRKVLGTKLAVRAMQIDRRLSLGYQLEMTTRIPLSH